MADFPMTRIPGCSGHFGQCPKRWAPGFPGIYFHMIHRYLKWSETTNYNIKKNNFRNQNLQGSTIGGGQGSTIISRTHSRTLEITPRGVPILDTSCLRVYSFHKNIPIHRPRPSIGGTLKEKRTPGALVFSSRKASLLETWLLHLELAS